MREKTFSGSAVFSSGEVVSILLKSANSIFEVNSYINQHPKSWEKTHYLANPRHLEKESDSGKIK